MTGLHVGRASALPHPLLPLHPSQSQFRLHIQRLISKASVFFFLFFFFCRSRQNCSNSCVTICINSMVHCKPYDKRYYGKRPVRQRQRAGTMTVLWQSAVSPTVLVSVTLGHLNSTELVSPLPGPQPLCSLCLQHTGSLCGRIIHTG